MIDTRPTDPDEMSAALEELAVSAEQTAAEQHELADSARALNRQRERGQPWSAVIGAGGPRPVLALLSASGRRLAETSRWFRTAVARALAHEGLSTRQIASRLGVTHQRVSAMLRGRDSGRAAPPPTDG